VSNRQNLVVVDGVAKKEGEGTGDLCFSSDSRRFAHTASHSKGRSTVVLDGSEHDPLDDITCLLPGRVGGNVFVWFGWIGRATSEGEGGPCPRVWQPGSKLYRFVAQYEGGVGQ
jgi:hypothetical protein